MDFQDFTKEEFALNESFQNWHLQLNKEDVEFWEDWIKQHPYKLEEVEQAKLLINNFVSYEKTTLPKEKIEEVVNKVQQSIKNRNKEKQKSFNPNHKLIWVAVAASLLLLIVFFGNNLKQYEVPQEVKTPTIEYVEKVVKKGRKLTVTLSDGSVIKLNADSKFRFPKSFSSETRKVFLEGEAFFDIAKDSTRPFIITTQNLSIEVLGTSFNVKNYNDNNAKIAVATGKVKVYTKSLNNTLTLLPSEMAVFDKNSQILTKTDFNPDEVFSWKNGVMYFNNNSVHEIFEELERWYGVEFRVSKGVNLNRKYTGRFTNESLNNVLEAIKFSTNFKYKIENEEVIIY